MINVLFTYGPGGRIKRFEMTGHDGSAPRGENVVCAAASALALTFAKSLVEIAEVELAGRIESGTIDLAFPEMNGRKAETAEVLLKSFILGLSSIRSEHFEAIEISERFI